MLWSFSLTISLTTTDCGAQSQAYNLGSLLQSKYFSTSSVDAIGSVDPMIYNDSVALIKVISKELPLTLTNLT